MPGIKCNTFSLMCGYLEEEVRELNKTKWFRKMHQIDKPEAKAQSKAQRPEKPQKGKRGIWPLG